MNIDYICWKWPSFYDFIILGSESIQNCWLYATLLFILCCFYCSRFRFVFYYYLYTANLICILLIVVSILWFFFHNNFSVKIYNFAISFSLFFQIKKQQLIFVFLSTNTQTQNNNNNTYDIMQYLQLYVFRSFSHMSHCVCTVYVQFHLIRVKFSIFFSPLFCTQGRIEKKIMCSHIWLLKCKA